jgi:hypothetical protein
MNEWDTLSMGPYVQYYTIHVPYDPKHAPYDPKP